MKSLYLIRHAKSSWSDPTLQDYDRPLNERGKRDTKSMGNRLLKKSIQPDLIIASSAKRTRQTAKRITKVIGYDSSSIITKKKLYHCSVIDMLDVTNKIEDKYQHVFILGHNYTISEYCDYLSGVAHPFPTCTIACITFDVDSWKEVSGGTGTLNWIDFPKNTNTIL